MKMCNSHDKDSRYRLLDAFVKFKLCKNLQLWNVGFCMIYAGNHEPISSSWHGKKTAKFVRSVLAFAITHFY